MEVVTFISASHGAVARIRMPMPSKGGAKIGWNPVLIHALTEEKARAKAEQFYADELERLSTKARNQAEGRAKAAATREARATQSPATEGGVS
ncbi:hypothetical protein [Brevundimonas sp.]|uniref:hypothetical protein n=1 Tax=Brevundimonas sp. TaxID=1871086 RepID=UPI00289A76A2|nr:hypothetical protein [Brevundimonas sp.]